MNPKTPTILAAALGLTALCALFPPRQAATGGTSVGRGFLFDPKLNQANFQRMDAHSFTFTAAKVDGARLAAECVFISALAGIVVLKINRPKDGPPPPA